MGGHGFDVRGSEVKPQMYHFHKGGSDVGGEVGEATNYRADVNVIFSVSRVAKEW